MLNDIYLNLSPSHKNDIKRMDENASEMQKENRIRWARLIQKQSELSARQHALSEKKLANAKIKEEYKSKKKVMEKYKKEVDDYQAQINLVNKEILQAKINLKELTTQISHVSVPDLTQIRTSISKRSKNINDAKVKIKKLRNEEKNLDFQKEELVKLIDSKQNALLHFNSREEKVSQTLQIPIDDLRLEEITISKLEQSVSQMNYVINTNDSTSNLNEEFLVKQIEEQNEKKKEQINQIKERVKLLKSLPPTPKSKKISKTPTKRFSKTQPIKYDENVLLHFSSTINSFKERQKMIDQLENTTTNVQIAWAADQKQIEDSWMGKMDDMQVLQKKVDEIENLIFDIDELSEKIHQLKEEELFINDKKSEYEKSRSKIESKLSEISEFHNSMQRQLDNYTKKKEIVDKSAENMKRKKKNVSILQNEVKHLEQTYKKYHLKVKTLEDKVSEIKNSFSTYASHSQIPEPFDRVKFDEYLIPQVNNVDHYSKTSITPQININDKVEQKKEQPCTPIVKKNNYQQGSFTPKHDKLSDSTFSVGELERNESISSLINTNANNQLKFSNNGNNSTFDGNNYKNRSNVMNDDSFNDSKDMTSQSLENSINKSNYNERYSSFDHSNNNRNSINASRESSFYNSAKYRDSEAKITKNVSENLMNSDYSNGNNKYSSLNSIGYKNRSSNASKQNSSKVTSTKMTESSPSKKANKIPSNKMSSSPSSKTKGSINSPNKHNISSQMNDSLSSKHSASHKMSENAKMNNSKTKGNTSSISKSSNSSQMNSKNSANNKSNINVSNSSKHSCNHDNNNNKSKTSVSATNSNISINKNDDIDSTLSVNSLDTNQDSQRSEIEIEFSDNENSKSQAVNSSLKYNRNSNLSTNEKLDSLKKQIQENEEKEELILSKYENNPKDNQYSSDLPSFNHKKYEAILNCTDSSRSVLMSNPNDTTFDQQELEDDDEQMIQEEEEEEQIENKNNNELNLEEEEENENDVFDNLSTYYQVEEEPNPIFPAPELFPESSHSGKNFNDYEYSKEVVNGNDENDSQATDFKTFFSESAESQITPTKKGPHLSRIGIDVNNSDTPNRYRRNHQIRHHDEESDDDFNNLVKEAHKAIDFPLLKSKYQSP